MLCSLEQLHIDLQTRYRSKRSNPTAKGAIISLKVPAYSVLWESPNSEIYSSEIFEGSKDPKENPGSGPDIEIRLENGLNVATFFRLVSCVRMKDDHTVTIVSSIGPKREHNPKCIHYRF